jgi:hypothetical protein
MKNGSSEFFRQPEPLYLEALRRHFKPVQTNEKKTPSVAFDTGV